jgi:hypothetical protein
MKMRPNQDGSKIYEKNTKQHPQGLPLTSTMHTIIKFSAALLALRPNLIV